MIISGH